MIKQWLEEYQPKNQKEAEQALRELFDLFVLIKFSISGPLIILEI